MRHDLLTNPHHDFWAVTTYFNLTGAQRRRNNYHCFRRHLSVPLMTVEWHPDRAFNLSEGDADVLLQVGGGDMMWQKERLLSLAIATLPNHVRYVAWLDCDVLFEDPDWASKAKALLASHCVIQPFSEAGFPDADLSAQILEMPAPNTHNATLQSIPTRPSFLGAFGRVQESVVDLDLGHRHKAEVNGSANIMLRPAHGLAWAAQRSFLRDIGLYERCICGAGDVFFCYGLTGLTAHLLASQAAGGWAFYGDCPSYHHWAARALHAATGRLGFSEGRVLHLFHGDMGERQYTTRIRGLVPFALDLDRDISALEGRPWVWRRDRNELNAYFLKYMRGRNEDGQHAPVTDVASGT